MRLANQHCNFGYQLHQCNNSPSVLPMSEAGWCQVVWTKMNPQKTSDLSVVRELDGRLTTCMSAHIHTRSTRCVIWTVSQSLSEEAADLTAATVVSVASPTASFTASVPSAGTERVICTTSTPINSSYSIVQSLSRCVSCRWLTTRYWPPSWSATAISASITTKLATPGTRTTFGDRVFAPAGPWVKRSSQRTDVCCQWLRKRNRGHQLCIADGDLVKLLSWTRHSCSSQLSGTLSCMQTSFQLMPAMLTNRMTAE